MDFIFNWPAGRVTAFRTARRGGLGFGDGENTLQRKWLQLALFVPLAVGVATLFFPGRSMPLTPQPGSSRAAESDALSPEQLVFLLQYLATDYPGAVRDGQIVDQAEYREMLEFADTLTSEYQAAAAGSPDPEISRGLETLRGRVAEKAEPAEIRAHVSRILPLMSSRLGVVSYPTLAPDLAAGKSLYAVNCARCHGASGDGRGPSAAGLDPAPSSFRDARMNQLAPHQVYNAVSFGVSGTDMPSHLESLAEKQRWDVAFYVMTLREDFKPAGRRDLGLSLRDLSSHSTADLLTILQAQGKPADPSSIDALRADPPGPSTQDLLELTRLKLERSLEAARRGDPEGAVRLSLEAYLEGVEPLEPALRQREPEILSRLERAFAEYRHALRAGAPPVQTASLRSRLDPLLKEAESALADSPLEAGLVVVQSLAIILREGVEAALLLGLMWTYLAAAGQSKLQRHVASGAVAGLAAGFATWIAAQWFLSITPVGQEALEGITSLLAAAVLFTVCFWIIHNADIQSWKTFIKQRADAAMGGGSGFALAAAAFLAVYREAFETVLFYQALWLRAPAQGAAVVAGFLAGGLALALLMVGMFQFGLKIPLKRFFTVTGLLLGWLCLSFAGYGVAELQNIGWIKQTPLGWIVEIPLLDIQSTVEGLGLQLGILLSFMLGALWGRARRSAPAGPAVARS